MHSLSSAYPLPNRGNGLVRRGSALGALLVTAALMICWPGLMGGLVPTDTNRMAERLRPARLRTLTVWQVNGEVEDAGLIRRLCAAFEKQNPGVRIFLRTAWPGEWNQPEAVLPDVLLFGAGDVQEPERTLLALSPGEGQRFACAQSGGSAYALPLWLSPEVLALPEEWQMEEPDWEKLLSPDGLMLPEGVTLQQLLLSCAPGLRPALRALADQPERTPKARVMSLARFHQTEGMAALPLRPAVCARVRFGSLCRDGELARDFLSFLWEQRGQAAQKYLLPVAMAAEGDGLMASLSELYGENPTLLNAFSHTREEISALCLDGFLRGVDPAETLLRMR